jgi:putative transcriptional regulator
MSPQQLRMLRESLGLSQADFARLMGVHPMTVSKWERGVANPTPYQEGFFNQFQAAAKNKIAQDELKNLLITAGVIAALIFLFQAASKK